MLNTFPVKEIWDFIAKQETITICTHIDPDGDTIGSAVALKELIELNTNVKEVRISGGDISKSFDFISKNIEDNVDDEFFHQSQVIVVDTSNKARVWDQRVITNEAVKIDHHKDVEEWLMKIGGDHWPACGQVIAEMAFMLNLKINSRFIEGVTTAIVTDTENFTQRNISSDTFAVMSKLLKENNYLKTIADLLPTAEETKMLNKFLSLVKYTDKMIILATEEVIPASIYRKLVGQLSSIKDKEVTLSIGKEENGKFYRCGLRSKGNVDVSLIAEAMGGGGHHSSSGFKLSVENSIEEIISKVKKLI